jgi:hypothetical protein
VLQMSLESAWRTDTLHPDAERDGDRELTEQRHRSESDLTAISPISEE